MSLPLPPATSETSPSVVRQEVNDEVTNSLSTSFSNIAEVKVKGSGKPIRSIDDEENALPLRKMPRSLGFQETLHEQRLEMAKKFSSCANDDNIRSENCSINFPQSSIDHEKNCHEHHSGGSGGGVICKKGSSIVAVPITTTFAAGSGSISLGAVVSSARSSSCPNSPCEHQLHQEQQHQQKIRNQGQNHVDERQSQRLLMEIKVEAHHSPQRRGDASSSVVGGFPVAHLGKKPTSKQTVENSKNESDTDKNGKNDEELDF